MTTDKRFKNWRYPLDASVDELLQNKDYIRDRNKLFREHKNGWWWFFGVKKVGKYMVQEYDEYMRNYIIDYDE